MSDESTLEKRLLEALEQMLGRFDIEKQTELVGELSQHFMDLLTKNEQAAVRAKAMEEMMAGMMADAAGVKDEALQALTDLMGGMEGLIGGFIGSDMGAGEKEAKKKETAEDHLDLSSMISHMIGSVDDLAHKLVKLIFPLIKIALVVLGLKRAEQVSQLWIEQVEKLVGALPGSETWSKLMSDIVEHLSQQPKRA